MITGSGLRPSLLAFLTLGLFGLSCDPVVVNVPPLGGGTEEPQTTMAMPDLSVADLPDLTMLPPPPPPDLAIPFAPNAHFVAPDGSDMNPGTLHAPWATIEFAATQMAPGWTTYLRDGTYAFSSKISASGTAGMPLTFTAYPGEAPTVIAPKNSFRSSTLEMEGNYIVIDRLRISDEEPSGIAVSMNAGSHDNVLSNCEIFGAVRSGVTVNGSHSKLYRNHIHNNGSHAALDHGIYLQGDNNLVQSNIIHDNWAMGIQIYSGLGWQVGSNVVEYNYVYHNGYGSPGVGQTYLNCEIYVGGANTQDNIVQNNVMCGGAHYAMYLWGGVTGTQIKYNISCNNQDGGFFLDGSGAGTNVFGNIFYNDGGPELLLGFGTTSDSNIYFEAATSPSFQWHGSLLVGLPTYVESSGQDKKSRIVDPAFSAPPPANGFVAAAAMSYNFCTTYLPMQCGKRP